MRAGTLLPLEYCSMKLAELQKFDGKHGQPAYVAVNDVIYDVSSSSYWQEGHHEGSHQAGGDLTEELKSAPHVRAVVERFPVVGRLDRQNDSEPSQKLPLLSILIIVAVLVLLVATFL